MLKPAPPGDFEAKAMFGIDGTEFLVIILVAVMVIGPKDMPKMLRAFARATARMRALAQEFRGHFDEAVRQADMQETVDSLKTVGDTVKGLDPRQHLREFYAALEKETELEREQRLQAENFAAGGADHAALAAIAPTAALPEPEPKAAGDFQPPEPVGAFAARALAAAGAGFADDACADAVDKAAACAVEGRAFVPFYRLPPEIAGKGALAAAARQESEL